MGGCGSTTSTAHARVDAAFSCFALNEINRLLTDPSLWLMRSRGFPSQGGWRGGMVDVSRATALEEDINKLDATSAPAAAFVTRRQEERRPCRLTN